MVYLSWSKAWLIRYFKKIINASLFFNSVQLETREKSKIVQKLLCHSNVKIIFCGAPSQFKHKLTLFKSNYSHHRQASMINLVITTVSNHKCNNCKFHLIFIQIVYKYCLQSHAIRLAKLDLRYTVILPTLIT